MAFDDRERTEAPTGRRRAEARRKGQVVKSQEVNTAAILFVTLGLLYFTGPEMMRTLTGMVGHGMSEEPKMDLTPESASTLLIGWMWEFVKVAGPFLGLLMVACVARMWPRSDFS